MTSPGTREPQTPAPVHDPAPDIQLDRVHAGDHWLDEVTSPADPSTSRATLFAMSTFAGPARLARRIFYFVATTPGKLFTVTLILTLALAAAGFSMSHSSAQRQEDLDVLLSTTEPMSNAAHNLYTSLSLADTLATTGFVQAGVENSINRQKYNDAIDRATIAATESVLGTQTSDQRIRDLVGFIQRQIPVYTGMVETARANHRAGNSVAVAYMSNASALMRDEVLPAAAELFRLTSNKVSQEQKSLTQPQWVPLSGLLAAVLFLVLAQWWLWRLTRRRINRGFATATILMTIALIWVGGSNLATWQASFRGFDDASRPWDALTTSRIEAQQTRTEETLALVRRQSVNNTSSTFEQTTSDIQEALQDYESSESIHRSQISDSATVDQSRDAISRWTRAHESFLSALRSGDYDKAIDLATDANPRPGTGVTSASAFNDLDSSLAKLIADSRESMRSYIQDGLSAMTMVSTAVLLLTIAAVLGVWLGIRPRLQEYL